MVKGRIRDPSPAAMIIAVPISFGIALFLTEVAPNWLRGPVAAAIELLAGIPSIIYGMWGLFVLAPYLGEHVYPWVNDNLGEMPLIGALFQGPPIGDEVEKRRAVIAARRRDDSRCRDMRREQFVERATSFEGAAELQRFELQRQGRRDSQRAGGQFHRRRTADMRANDVPGGLDFGAGYHDAR